MSKSSGRTKTRFVCRQCKAEFTGGRGLGSHYAEHPDHRPVRRAPRRGRKGAADQSDSQALIRLAVDRVGQEIDQKRRALASVDTLRAEITALENRREALKKLLG